MSKENEYNTIPIPTYEEATSSRPHSSQSRHGPEEISDDAERQGLLGLGLQNAGRHGTRTGDRQGNYRQPTVESARESLESDFTEPELEEDEAELRRDMEQMEILEPEEDIRAQQRLRNGLSKRIASITNTFSSIPFPSFSFITSRIPSIPSIPSLPNMTVISEYVPRWHILARLCGLFILISVVYALVVSRTFMNRPFWMAQQFQPEILRGFLASTIDPERIRRHLMEIAFDDHMAGTQGDFYLAQRIEEEFKEAGLDSVDVDNYQVYLNYPTKAGRRVAIVDPPELAWQAFIDEKIVPGKEQQHQTHVFHGLSRSGNVTGPLIYANYGSQEDFDWLKDQKIDLTGSIVLVRYYGTQADRGLKVKAAELAGAAGCLIYSDPQDDGFVRGKTYPEGPWRPDDSVQRGTVALSNWILGDVLTPGEASLPGVKRISKDNNPALVNIPSLPLAWRDAKPLLQALKGKGSEVPKAWVGGVPDVEWWSGNSNASPRVHLMNLQDEIEEQPIRNIIGRIEGVESPEKVIYVGNHRDAWCFGAMDPGSGTAVMLEVVRAFGELMKAGPWRPRRTIVFASWDAEEYNLIGSTEHVEERIQELQAHGIAYLNVDVGVAGNHFRAASSPLLSTILFQTLDNAYDPEQNKTLLQLWQDTGSKLGELGAGSDHAAFQYMAGCSSLDFGFQGPAHSYPYHSCYETDMWFNTFADAKYEYSATLARVWALLLIELADRPVLPFDFNAYAGEIARYVKELKEDVERAPGRSADKPSLLELEQVTATLIRDAEEFMKWEEDWINGIKEHGMLEDEATRRSRISHNWRITDFETHLLDIKYLGDDDEREFGLPGRSQYKHVISAPPLWDGYAEEHFPGVRDAMRAGNWQVAKEQLDIAVSRLKLATWKLLH